MEGGFNDARCQDIDNNNACHDESSSKSWIAHNWFFLNEKNKHPDNYGNDDKNYWLDDHNKQFNKEDILIVSFYQHNKAIHR